MAKKRIEVIQSNLEFNNILKNGRIFQNNLFLIAAQEEGTERIGFTTSAGLKSVERNRLKRLLKSLWIKNRDEVHFCGKIIFLIKKNALKYKFEELEKSFRILLAKFFENEYKK